MNVNKLLNLTSDRKRKSMAGVVVLADWKREEVLIWLRIRFSFKMRQSLILICYGCWIEDWRT